MDEKDVRKAIEIFKGIEEIRGDLPEDANDIEGALIDAVEALKKQLPKKPIECEEQEMRYITTYTCPCCGGKFTGRISRYCYQCGQKFDWSGN